MRIIIIFAILLIGIINCSPILRQRRETTTTAKAPSQESTESIEDAIDDEGIDDDPAAERGRIAAEYFPGPIPRARAKKILERALELINKPQKRQRLSCRRENIDQDAKNALRFLTGDPSIGSTSDDSSQPASIHSEGSLVCERDFTVNNTERRISQSTIESIVRLHESGQSERSIKRKNKWYSCTLLPRFQKFVAEGGSLEQKWKSIDDYVDNKVQEAHAANLPIHEYMHRQWAIKRADEIGADDFTASRHWIHDFKQRHPVVSRAVTGYRSRAERNRAEQIKESIEEFQRQYGAIRHHFPYRLIWNMDQSPFAYEVSNKRSLAPRGCRDVILDIDSKNKNTHSYTSQPTISRDGKLVDKLLLCLQEDDNKFGPLISNNLSISLWCSKKVVVFGSHSLVSTI